jgi:hypothetical protein
MQIKSVTLYSLPYVVGIAGILVAVHQVVPTPKSISLWDANAKDGTFSGQTANRPLKSDRSPILSTTPQAPAKGQINTPVKTRETIIV